MSNTFALDQYRLLGRSGLRVSPLALGTMTFGQPGWGADEAEARRMFDLYVDRGGNFVDTAGYYAGGVSEGMTGKFAAAKRDRLVLSTKYSMMVEEGDPNAAGNGRKSMRRAIDISLKRLGTDYIDVYFLHMWDTTTPADEILRGLDDLVASGKILYIAISDTPAWEVSRMQMMAELRGWSQFCALQAEYNLLERTAERELIPMAQKLGLGLMPWSPLASGRLSGKYATNATAPDSSESDRKAGLIAHGMMNDQTLVVADAVMDIASELGVTSAQVALAWTLTNPAVSATLLGTRTVAQLEDNLGALDVALDATALARLDAVSSINPGFPHTLLELEFVQAGLTAHTSVRRR